MHGKRTNAHTNTHTQTHTNTHTRAHAHAFPGKENKEILPALTELGTALRKELARANATLLASLLALVHKYNTSSYVEPLFFSHPVEHDCPFNDEHGVLTPCDIPSDVVPPA